MSNKSYNFEMVIVLLRKVCENVKYIRKIDVIQKAM